MNRFGGWLIVFAGLFDAFGETGLNHASISGRDYVRLADWAKAHHYEITQSRSSELVQLTSADSRLMFAVDSQRAEINGISIYLSFPIASHSGDAFIAELDLRTAIHPILFSQRDPRTIPVINICLDPGHGGKDPGNQEGRNKEKEYTLLLAFELRKLLVAAGMKVTMTRQTDSFVPLPDRPEIAGKRDADLFISLHFNAAIANKDEVRGIEVYCLTPAGARSTHTHGDYSDTAACPGNRLDSKNILLAYQLQKALVRELQVADRGVKRARFAVLRPIQMPAVLIEAGFMSHPSEAKKILDPEYRRQMARAVVDGIMAYKRKIEP